MSLNENVAFYIQTYRDTDQLYSCLTELRRVYKKCNIVICADGDYNPRIGDVARKFSASVHFGTRLFGVESGGLVTQRMLRLLLATRAEYLIKIDPDTVVRRQVDTNSLPSDVAVFGTVQSLVIQGKITHSIQGGAIIITRSAAKLIYDSRILESEALKPPELVWCGDNELLLERAKQGLTSHDWTLAWACRELKISMRSTEEICSHWKKIKFKRINRYFQSALVHPRQSWARLTLTVIHSLGPGLMRKLAVGGKVLFIRIASGIAKSPP